MACKLKEKFALYYIKQLINSNFGRKPWKFCALIPTSSTGPPSATTSETLALSAPAPINIPIYLTQLPGIGPISVTYSMQQSGARLITYT